MEELVVSFHDGVAIVQIARQTNAAVALTTSSSPGPVDTIALARTTEDMMAELSNMLELNNYSADSQGLTPPNSAHYEKASPQAIAAEWQAQPSPPSEVESAKFCAPQMLLASPSHSLKDMPQKNGRLPKEPENTTENHNIQNNTHIPHSELFIASPPDPATPFVAASKNPVGAAQRSMPPPASESAPHCASDKALLGAWTAAHAPPVPVAVSPLEDEKAMRAAERREHFLNSASSTPSVGVDRPAPVSQSKGMTAESDVLKRCQASSFDSAHIHKPSPLLFSCCTLR